MKENADCSLEQLTVKIARLDERLKAHERATETALVSTRWLWMALIGVATLAVSLSGLFHK